MIKFTEQPGFFLRCPRHCGLVGFNCTERLADTTFTDITVGKSMLHRNYVSQLILAYKVIVTDKTGKFTI